MREKSLATALGMATNLSRRLHQSNAVNDTSIAGMAISRRFSHLPDMAQGNVFWRSGRVRGIHEFRQPQLTGLVRCWLASPMCSLAKLTRGCCSGSVRYKVVRAVPVD